MSTVTRAKSEVHYPVRDGKPMGETGIHVDATIDLHVMVRDVIFRGRPDVYFTSDMFFYYEEGNPKAVKAPDLMVIKGVKSKEPRQCYKLWVEGILPCLIVEVTSKSSRRDDVVDKKELYARLGIHEYFLFDPLGDYLNPRLQGYRLRGGIYEPVEPGPDGMLESLELGVKLNAEGIFVRMYEIATGRLIPNLAEQAARGEMADALERDLIEERKSRAKLERKTERERKKAEAERQKAEAERQKAEAERRRADALEAELNRLRALLGEGGNPPGA